MNQSFDIMVAGLGANGSSALYQLSKTGEKVVGIDRFTPPHIHGSSHGESRIIRQAYYEDPIYVPLLKTAYKLWKEIEDISRKNLFLQTGGLMLGNPDSAVIKGSELSARTHDIPYEYLDADAIQKRFPAFHPTPDTVGILEKEAGILFPEKCIQTFLDLAAAKGATINTGEKILQITPGKDKVVITTTKDKYIVNKLILTAGAWTSELLPDLNIPLTVKRQPLFWLTTGTPQQNHRFLPTAMPIYIWEYTPGKMFYGFPDLGTGIKIAPHHRGRTIQPDQLTQEVSPEEIKEIKDIAAEYFGIKPVFDHSSVCMYTNTPDEHFIIDLHPEYKNIIIASPCSGHGFKFSSLTGRLLSDIALEHNIGFDLSPFSLTRFSS